MKRDFNAVLTDLDGQPFQDGNHKYKVTDEGKLVFANSEPVILERAKDLTLCAVCTAVIGAAQEGDDKMAGDAKFKLYELADKIIKGSKAGEPVDITAEDITTLKARIARQYTMFVVGAAFRLLDADYVEKASAAAE